MDETALQQPKPAVVAHAGARDMYQVALALHEAGLLGGLATDLYASPRTVAWLRETPARRWADALAKRSCPGLEIGAVEGLPLALAAAELAERSDNAYRWWARSDRIISLAALRKARQTGSSLYLYSYNAYAAFRRAADEAIPKILFQVHPEAGECRRLLCEELERVPAARATLMLEREMHAPEEEIARAAYQLEVAEHIVVASSFTRRTLLSKGVPAQKISVIPYGVDAEAFPERPAPRPTTGPLRIAFLGSFYQRKGVSYLLEAVSAFPASQVQLVVATRSPPRSPLGLDNVEICANPPRHALPALLHGCDVFALPSLIEGFGLSLLEAMSAGLPAIATPNTCAADIVTDGVDGFLVPIRDAGAIREAIKTCLDRRETLAEMSRAAAATARSYSWARFRQAIVADYRAFMQGR